MTICCPQNSGFDFCNQEIAPINPYEYVGIAHNCALEYVEGIRVSNELEVSYRLIHAYLAGGNGLSMAEIVPFSQFEKHFPTIVEDGYAYFKSIMTNSTKAVQSVLKDLRKIISDSVSEADFLDRIDALVLKTRQGSFVDQNQAMLLSAIALAKHSLLFWVSKSEVDFFSSKKNSRRKGGFWADLGGFVAGFVGTLIYNNNNGSGPDGNPFTNGTAVGGLASAAARKK